ncbi:MAG: competence/damage-inducible protein A [Nitrospirae bacterium]|nr:competence/damage-inducible protein A [Nitrospirota bacterium]
MSDDTLCGKTAGIIIIGNEILSAKVQDSNSFFLAAELRALGVSVMRITVLPDDIDTIGREAGLFSEAFDFVLTSGGVGPTHDDVTMEGIAKGFGVKLVRSPELERLFRQHYGDAVNEAVMKMAYVPEGCEFVRVEDGRFPLVSFRNIFIFPGIPEFLRKKFSQVKERFRSTSFCLKRLFVNAEEAEIAAVLNRVVEAYPEVTFGSYPILGNPEYKIILTAESRSMDAVTKAVKELISRIPTHLVVRVCQ